MIDDSSFAWLYVILYTTILPDISASSGHDGIIKGERLTFRERCAASDSLFLTFASETED
jgi:hypothetical protein